MSDHNLPSTIAVVATNLEKGNEYAKALGLEEYRVFTEEMLPKIQGLRTRAVVVTPGYIDAAWRAYWDKMQVFETAQRNMIMWGTTTG